MQTLKPLKRPSPKGHGETIPVYERMHTFQPEMLRTYIIYMYTIDVDVKACTHLRLVLTFEGNNCEHRYNIIYTRDLSRQVGPRALGCAVTCPWSNLAT